MRTIIGVVAVISTIFMLLQGCSREQRVIDNKFKEAIKLYREGKIYDARRNLQSVEELLQSLEPDKRLINEYRLANTYHQLGYLDEAYTHYKHYAKALKTIPVKDTLQAILQLVEVAEAFTELGKFQEAQQVLSDARHLWNRLSPSKKDDFNDSLAFYKLQEGFAFFYLNTFNFPKAESLYTSLLKPYTTILAYDNSKEYVTFLLRLADTYMRAGKTHLADSIISIATQELENKISKNALDEAEVLNMLSQVYENKGELGKALQTAQKAMEIYEKHLGKEHPFYVSAHFNYTGALQSLKRIDTAIAESFKGLALSKKIFGDTSIYTSRYYNMLGMLYTDKASFQEEYRDSAIAFLNEALNRIIPITGEESFPVAVLYNNISNAYIDNDEKFKMRKKALDIGMKILPADHPFNLLAMANLAQTSAMIGEKELADSLYQIVFSNADKLNPLHILQFKFNYGVYKYFEQDYEKAIRVLSEVVETYENNKSYHSGGSYLQFLYSAGMAYLGFSYMQQNMPELAKIYLSKADSIMASLDIKDSPQVQNIHNNVKKALELLESS